MSYGNMLNGSLLSASCHMLSRYTRGSLHTRNTMAVATLHVRLAKEARVLFEQLFFCQIDPILVHSRHAAIGYVRNCVQACSKVSCIANTG